MVVLLGGFSQVLIYTPRWREATVKCLAQGHKYQGRSQDSNSHSDDSSIRTQVQFTKPLSHDALTKNQEYHNIDTYLLTVDC